MKSLQADFFISMKNGALQYSKEHPEIELLCCGTDSQIEIDEQIELVNSLIEEKVDGIVLVPIDSKALVDSVVRAVKSGIPVINIDIKLDEELLKENNVDVAFVGPDNFEAAYEVGKLLCAKLNVADEVAVIEGLKGADNALMRKEGFMKAIAESNLHVVASETANWETFNAERIFNDILKKHPSLKGVFCSNDAMALGVLKAMDDNEKYLPLVGFDNDVSINRYLKNGRLIGTVDIYSSSMAVHGIEFLLDVLKGVKHNKGNYSTPFKIIT